MSREIKDDFRLQFQCIFDDYRIWNYNPKKKCWDWITYKCPKSWLSLLSIIIIIIIIEKQCTSGCGQGLKRLFIVWQIWNTYKYLCVNFIAYHMNVDLEPIKKLFITK